MESFQQEGRCYLWLIPQVQAMRAQKNLKPLAFPKCFYISSEDSILILENMKAQNFDVIPKKLERKNFDDSCSKAKYVSQYLIKFGKVF
jgi:Ecdysteroid kinase-like family